MRTDALTASILAEVEMARSAALAMRVPDRHVEDVVQEALLATWRRAQHGDFPTDRAALRIYLYVTAKNIAAAHWRKLGRADLPGDLPDTTVDPLPRLEARSELRVLAKPAYLRALYESLAAGDSLMDLVRSSGVPQGTAYGRVRKLRMRLRPK